MKIEETLSSCSALLDYASNSSATQIALLTFFVVFPFVKILATIAKTYNKTKEIEKYCSQVIPAKLKKIIIQYKLSNNLFLVSCNNDFAAISIGFFSKKIVISRNLINNISQKELEAIVLHELHHVKSNHSIILFFSQLIVSTFFFIPILKDFQLVIKLELEKSADKYAVSIQKTAKHVKNSLKRVLVGNDDFSLFPKFSYDVIDQRINSLNSKKTKLTVHPIRLAFSALSIMILGFVYLSQDQVAIALNAYQRNDCNIIDCVQDCVAYEFNREPMMSEMNYSIDF